MTKLSLKKNEILKKQQSMSRTMAINRRCPLLF